MYAIEIMSKNGGSVKLGVQNRLKDSIFNRKVTLDLYPNEIAVVYDYFNVHSRYRNFWNKDFTPNVITYHYSQGSLWTAPWFVLKFMISHDCVQYYNYYQK